MASFSISDSLKRLNEINHNAIYLEKPEEIEIYFYELNKLRIFFNIGTNFDESFSKYGTDYANYINDIYEKAANVHLVALRVRKEKKNLFPIFIEGENKLIHLKCRQYLASYVLLNLAIKRAEDQSSLKRLIKDCLNKLRIFLEEYYVAAKRYNEYIPTQGICEG